MQSGRRRYLGVQAIGYLIFAVVGVVNFRALTGDPTWQLNTAAHLLHLGLFVLGLSGVLLMASATAPVDAARSSNRVAAAPDAEDGPR